MLSRHDAQLAHRDPSIPSLPLLFDEEAFRQRLNEARPPSRFKNISLNYVRYKPGTSCIAAFEGETETTTIQFYAKGMSLDTAHKLRKASQRISGYGEENRGLILEDTAVAVYFFPEDHDVTILPRLSVAKSRRDLLQETLNGHEDLWDVELDTLRYKPERRYVAQMVTPDGGSALLKVYAGNDYHSAQRGGKIFNSREHLRVAKRLGRSNRHKMIILEWLDGKLISEAMKEPGFNQTYLRHTAAALVELHNQRPRDLKEANLEGGLNALRSAAADLAILCPSKADTITRLIQRTISTLSSTKKMYYSVHNDFSADQVLITNGHIGFLDFDLATRGDRFMDLASFVARFEYSVLVGETLAIQPGEAIDTFLDAYQELSGKRLRSALNHKIAISLLRLAPEPFRYRLPNWPQLTERIIERADMLSRRKFTLSQWISPNISPESRG